jgi:RimJ/RimL family protein N-acetyltransferase
MLNHVTIPVLETQRLLLRGHKIEDFNASAEMWADPLVVAYISGVPSTKSQSWDRFLRYAGLWCQLGFGYWVVETKTDRRFIGEIGFADFKRDTSPCIEGIPEAGWVLKSQAHGQGFAAEAVKRALEWADCQLNFEKTVCLFDPVHVASISVAEKVGYGHKTVGRFGEKEALFMERPRR